MFVTGVLPSGFKTVLHLEEGIGYDQVVFCGRGAQRPVLLIFPNSWWPITLSHTPNVPFPLFLPNVTITIR